MCNGNSLDVQWLGLGAFTAEGPGSILGQGSCADKKGGKKGMCNSQSLTLGIKFSLFLPTLLLCHPPSFLLFSPHPYRLSQHTLPAPAQLPLHFLKQIGLCPQCSGQNILLPKLTVSSAKLSGFSLGLTLGTGPAD